MGIGYGVSDEFRYLYPPTPTHPSFFFGLHLGEGRDYFFPIQADKSVCCVLVLCLDDRVSFLSGERGDLIYIYFLVRPPPFFIYCHSMSRRKKNIFFFSNLTTQGRRPDRTYSKILTTIVSTFTSYYIHHWPSFFPDKPLSSPLPSFDGRIVQYPTVENLRDYLSWRQVDCMFLLQ